MGGSNHCSSLSPLMDFSAGLSTSLAYPPHRCQRAGKASEVTCRDSVFSKVGVDWPRILGKSSHTRKLPITSDCRDSVCRTGSCTMAVKITMGFE